MRLRDLRDQSAAVGDGVDWLRHGDRYVGLGDGFAIVYDRPNGEYTIYTPQETHRRYPYPLNPLNGETR